MAKATFIRDNTKCITDKEHGEILQDFVVEKICDSQEEWLKIYVNSLDDLAKIDHLTFQVLIIVLKRARFCEKDNKDGNEFFNNDNFKKEAKKKLGFKNDNTVNKYISKLSQAKFLLRINKGSYILNPRYFARGKMTPKTRMELIVKYNG